jgi:hypothetical protein
MINQILDYIRRALTIPVSKANDPESDLLN